MTPKIGKRKDFFKLLTWGNTLSCILGFFYAF